MASRKAVRKTAAKQVKADPTLPLEVITIDGYEYRLCFDLNAICDAETRLANAGHDVSFLAAAFGRLSLDMTRQLFIGSLLKYQPDLTYEDGTELFVKANLPELLLRVMAGYRKFLPGVTVKAAKDPQEPGE